VDPRASFVLVGLSHRTAPIAVRERYVVRHSELQAVVTALRGLPDVAECFVLSTCNRTEVLAVGTKGVDLVQRLQAQLFRNLEARHVYSYADVQALIHLFRVASGLDSIVLGESEVLAQIKQGMEASSAAGALGPALRPLLQQALHVGKRVRAETSLGRGTLSVARVGIDVASRVFGSFERVNALVVGAGETGILVARHLRERGVGGLSFATRRPERAQEAALELKADVSGLDRLKELVARADLIVACVEADAPPIEVQHFDRRALARRDRPMVVLDLSVPRAVAAQVASLSPNLIVSDLDDLQRAVHENERGRARAVDGTSEILVAEIHKFLTLRTYSAFTPAIADLRRRFEQVRETTLDAISGARTDPKEVQIAHELTKRLLDVALDQMKAGARSVSSEETLEVEYQRFLQSLSIERAPKRDPEQP